jgi:FkbM family methyltransferase
MGRIRSAAAETRWSLHAAGPKAAAGCALTHLGLRSKPWRLRPPSGPPVEIRFGSADVLVYEQVMQERQYDVRLSEPPKLIVDAGAHIGLASVHFATRFPGAKILAVEPQRDNFELLRRNVERLPNVEPVHAALAAEPGPVRIANPDDPSWSYRVTTAAGDDAETVDAVTVAQLIERSGEERLGLLKIDIEGAEAAVFGASDPWIDRVETIVAELHEELEPGAERAFEQAVEGFEKRWEIGDVIWVSRDRAAAPAAAG